jgi:hypothetical protein
MDEFDDELPALTEQEIMDGANVFQEHLIAEKAKNHRKEDLFIASRERDKKLIELTQNIADAGNGALIPLVLKLAGEYMQDYKLTGYLDGLDHFFATTDNPLLRPQLDTELGPGYTIKQYIMDSLRV